MRKRSRDQKELETAAIKQNGKREGSPARTHRRSQAVPPANPSRDLPAIAAVLGPVSSTRRRSAVLPSSTTADIKRKKRKKKEEMEMKEEIAKNERTK